MGISPKERTSFATVSVFKMVTAGAVVRRGRRKKNVPSCKTSEKDLPFGLMPIGQKRSTTKDPFR